MMRDKKGKAEECLRKSEDGGNCRIREQKTLEMIGLDREREVSKVSEDGERVGTTGVMDRCCLVRGANDCYALALQANI